MITYILATTALNMDRQVHNYSKYFIQNDKGNNAQPNNKTYDEIHNHKSII